MDETTAAFFEVDREIYNPIMDGEDTNSCDELAEITKNQSLQREIDMLFDTNEPDGAEIQDEGQKLEYKVIVKTVSPHTKPSGVERLMNEQRRIDKEYKEAAAERKLLRTVEDSIREKERFDVSKSLSAQIAVQSICADAEDMMEHRNKRKLAETSTSQSQQTACIEPHYAVVEKEREKEQKKIPVKRTRKRRKKITVKDMPEIVKFFGGSIKACVMNHLYGGEIKDGQLALAPNKDDCHNLQQAITHTDTFKLHADTLARELLEDCTKMFTMKKNEVMLQVLKALTEIKEYHGRPTVKKIPSDKAVDAWTNEKITNESIKTKASVIFRPENEKLALTNTIITPKLVPEFLGLVHFVLHLSAYVESYVKEGIKEVDRYRLNKSKSFGEAWAMCAGEKLAVKAIHLWPKNKNAKVSNKFTIQIIDAREHLMLALTMKQKLSKIVKDMEMSHVNK